MSTIFHSSPVLLGAGSVIMPGNLGRISGKLPINDPRSYAFATRPQSAATPRLRQAPPDNQGLINTSGRYLPHGQEIGAAEADHLERQIDRRQT